MNICLLISLCSTCWNFPCGRWGGDQTQPELAASHLALSLLTYIRHLKHYPVLPQLHPPSLGIRRTFYNGLLPSIKILKPTSTTLAFAQTSFPLNAVPIKAVLSLPTPFHPGNRAFSSTDPLQPKHPWSWTRRQCKQTLRMMSCISDLTPHFLPQPAGYPFLLWTSIWPYS